MPYGMRQPDTDLRIYVIYRGPSDYPGRCVCRIHRIRASGDVEAENNLYANEETIEAVRAKLPPGLVQMLRHPDDDTAIAETWI